MDRGLLRRPTAERAELLSAQKRFLAGQSLPDLGNREKDPRLVFEVRAVDFGMLVKQTV